jgi:hypothetical protein
MRSAGLRLTGPGERGSSVATVEVCASSWFDSHVADQRGWNERVSRRSDHCRPRRRNPAFCRRGSCERRIPLRRLRIRDHRLQGAPAVRHVRLRVVASRSVESLKSRGNLHARSALEAKQPLHLMPHGDAQIDAEREQSQHDQPEADVRGAPLARAPQPGFTPRPLTPIFATDDARVVDGHIRRGRLPCGLRHPLKFSGLTGSTAKLPGPRSRCARVHARSCQGCQPCLRARAPSSLVLATQEAGNATDQATRRPACLHAAILPIGGR